MIKSQINKNNFYERLSATLYGKQVLFKQDDGSYYNQSVHDTMTKSDVKEWLLAEVGELCKDKQNWNFNDI